MAQRLILIRHGQVEERYAGRYVGSTDAALSVEGRRQAGALAPFLAARRPALCLCSPLRRCLETARAAAAGLDLPVRVEPDLREVDFGAWEGLSFAEIAGRDPDAVSRWARLDPGFRFPGGESVGEFDARVRAASGRIAAADGTVVAFTHGGVARFMLCALLGLEPRSHGAFAIRPAGVAELTLCEGVGQLVHLGDAPRTGEGVA